jgi:hypothetical protein
MKNTQIITKEPDLSKMKMKNHKKWVKLQPNLKLETKKLKNHKSHKKALWRKKAQKRK